jgi:hypothetical protein
MSRLKDVFTTAQVILSLVSIGTIATALGWLFKKRQERFENRILKFFEESDEWHGADGIVGDIYIRAALKGLPAYLLHQPITSGWQNIKMHVKATPYLFRYHFQKLVFLPRRSRIESTLRNLWKRGLLTKASFNPKYYRLKH